MEKLPITEHTEGRFEQAEKKYLEIKSLSPNNNDVNFWLGYLYFQKNDFISAEKAIVDYLKINNNLKAWNLLGLIYQNLKMFEQSKIAFLNAIKINDKYFDAHFNLAVLLSENKYYDEAIETLNYLIDENFEDNEPYFLIGFCYQQKNNFNMALHFYNTALNKNYVKPELYFNMINIFCDLEQFDNAKEFIEDGLKLFPNNEDILISQAYYYEKIKDYDNNKLILLSLINKGCNNYLPYFRIANYYKSIWQLNDAEEYYKKALILSPNNIDILLNFGVLNHVMGKFEEAAELFILIIKQEPNHLSALNNLANTYLDLMDFESAKEIYRTIFTLYPEAALEHFNYGLALLLNENLLEGFKHYEYRLKLDQYSREIINRNRWQGEDLLNKTILVYGEQGIGDIIMFSRFFTNLKNRYNCKIIFECRIEIINLIKLNFPFIKFIERGESLENFNFDYYCSLLSLPLFLNIKTINEINNEPYLIANKDLESKWSEVLTSSDFIKIGFVWKGNPYPIEHRKRHTDLKYFINLSKLNNVKLFSLQFGENCKEILEENGITELAYNFDETAAIIKNLDLVITVDTSIAHLSAALGVKTWILLTKVPDWRWGLNKNKSYWYNTVKLFRQNNFNNWSDVFDDITKELKELTHNKIESELSLTELKNKAFELLESNNFNESIIIYKHIIANFNNDFESYIWLGLAEYNIGNYLNAINRFGFVIDNLITLPEEIFNYYCLCYLNSGKYKEGIEVIINFRDKYKNSCEIINTLGLLNLAINKKEDALKLFESALNIDSKFIPAAVNIANTFFDNKDFTKAITFSEKYLIENSEVLELYKIVGNSYLSLNNPFKAIKYYKFVAPKINDHKLFNNYGIALQRVHNYHLAFFYLNKAIELSKDNFGYWANLGNNYSLTHNFKMAFECYYEGLKYSPNNNSLISMIGLNKLLTENFEEGWKLFEYSLTQTVPFVNIPNCKEYNNEELLGKTILVYSEHGLGDTLQFIRYLPLLKQKGCDIIFEIQKELKPLLFYTSGYYKPIIKGEYDLHSIKADYYISLLKLPRLLCTNIANIPKLAHIISVDKLLVEKYKSLLINNKKKVGLVWAGNPEHPNDHNRSLPFNYLKILFNNKNCHYYLLQQSEFQLPEDFNEFTNLTNLRNELTSLKNTVAIILNLDLIITVDTMIAHLSAALNKPTFLLLPYLPDWRWLLNRDNSIWYDSIKIFRQINPGDWSYPLEQVFRSLSDTAETKEIEQKIKQLIDKSDYDKAIDLLQNDLLQPGNKSFLLNDIALVFINLKDYETAISILETALKLDTSNYEIFYN
ncbi:MAG TPA: glycosyltransferase family 9 protein, partial [Melioribacteraceae bacterium]|nr:glycosyltransferase family 9 protein [Melioribacteraceae bacterium]